MDGDGYRDGYEFVLGTDAADPTDQPDGVPPTTPGDADDDALSDADEAVHGTDPNDWDTDDDGYSDGFETGQVYTTFTFQGRGRRSARPERPTVDARAVRPRR